jgi:hypothetical protein
MENGTIVIYVAGNHDEVMRRFAGLKMGNFSFVHKVVLNLDGKKSWFFTVMFLCTIPNGLPVLVRRAMVC